MTFLRSGFFFFAVAVTGFGPLPRPRQKRHGQYIQISVQTGTLPPYSPSMSGAMPCSFETKSSSQDRAQPFREWLAQEDCRFGALVSCQQRRVQQAADAPSQASRRHWPSEASSSDDPVGLPKRPTLDARMPRHTRREPAHAASERLGQSKTHPIPCHPDARDV
jgi:hypothetical protein